MPRRRRSRSPRCRGRGGGSDAAPPRGGGGGSDDAPPRGRGSGSDGPPPLGGGGSDHAGGLRLIVRRLEAKVKQIANLLCAVVNLLHDRPYVMDGRREDGASAGDLARRLEEEAATSRLEKEESAASRLEQATSRLVDATRDVEGATSRLEETRAAGLNDEYQPTECFDNSEEEATNLLGEDAPRQLDGEATMRATMEARDWLRARGYDM